MSATIPDTTPARRTRAGRRAAERPRNTRTLAVVGALLRKELRVELRTFESVPAMSLFASRPSSLFHFGAQPRQRRRRPRARRAVGDAAVRGGARHQPPVRRRRRAGRLRRLPALAGRPQRAADREGADAARLPARARAGRGAGVRACCCWRRRSARRCRACSECSRSATSASPRSARSSRRSPCALARATCSARCSSLPLLVPIVIGGARASDAAVLARPRRRRAGALAVDPRAL